MVTLLVCFSSGLPRYVVTYSTSLLSDQDRTAIATYIKSLPPVDGPPKPKKADKDGDKS